jgi:hypothetical protein
MLAPTEEVVALEHDLIGAQQHFAPSDGIARDFP